MVSDGGIWPNFFLVGAAKCGTTSLYSELKKHPQVFLPEMKEPNFFAAGTPPNESSLGVPHCKAPDEYLRLYRRAQGFAAIGDASNSYLWDKDASRRINEVCPSAKILVMLRDPVVRAHSFYLMNMRCGDDSSRTFQEALQQDGVRSKSNWFTSWLYVEGGLYYEQVRRYFDTFGRDQVLVLLFEDLAANPRELFHKVALHIGVDPKPFDAIEAGEAYNAYRMPRFQAAYHLAGRLGLRSWLLPPSVRGLLSHNRLLFDHKKPSLDDESRRFLQGIYDPDIVKLENLLGRKLPELRKSWKP